MTVSEIDGLEGAATVRLKAQERVFEPGDVCTHFYYLLDGTIRVELLSRAGKPITLYRFGAGETCILTTACLLSGESYIAEAVTESPVEALALPVSTFRERLNGSAPFRELVFQSFAQRLATMMAKIEAVTSVPVDQRLAEALLFLTASDAGAEVTHDQLAAESGTAREVVSRKLALWEKNQWIRRGRGHVDVLNRGALASLARK
ncbi:MAG: Crp/Fnr family transcriptional regulator [Parvularcula sp.]